MAIAERLINPDLELQARIDAFNDETIKAHTSIMKGDKAHLLGEYGHIFVQQRMKRTFPGEFLVVSAIYADLDGNLEGGFVVDHDSDEEKVIARVREQFKDEHTFLPLVVQKAGASPAPIALDDYTRLLKEQNEFIG